MSDFSKKYGGSKSQGLSKYSTEDKKTSDVNLNKSFDIAIKYADEVAKKKEEEAYRKKIGFIPDTNLGKYKASDYSSKPLYENAKQESGSLYGDNMFGGMVSAITPSNAMPDSYKSPKQISQESVDSASTWLDKHFYIPGSSKITSPRKEAPNIFEYSEDDTTLAKVGKFIGNMPLDMARFAVNAPEDIQNQGLAKWVAPNIFSGVEEKINAKAEKLIAAGTPRNEAFDIAGRWQTGKVQQRALSDAEKATLKADDVADTALATLDALNVIGTGAGVKSVGGSIKGALAGKSTTVNDIFTGLSKSKSFNNRMIIRDLILESNPKLSGTNELEKLVDIAQSKNKKLFATEFDIISENANKGELTPRKYDTMAMSVEEAPDGTLRVVENAKFKEENASQLLAEKKNTFDGKNEYFRLSNPDIYTPEIREGMLPKEFKPKGEIPVYKISSAGDTINIGDNIYLNKREASLFAKENGLKITQDVANIDDLVRATDGTYIVAPKAKLNAPALPPVEPNLRASIQKAQTARNIVEKKLARSVMREKINLQKEIKAAGKKKFVEETESHAKNISKIDEEIDRHSKATTRKLNEIDSRLRMANTELERIKEESKESISYARKAVKERTSMDSAKRIAIFEKPTLTGDKLESYTKKVKSRLYKEYSTHVDDVTKEYAEKIKSHNENISELKKERVALNKESPKKAKELLDKKNDIIKEHTERLEKIKGNEFEIPSKSTKEKRRANEKTLGLDEGDLVQQKFEEEATKRAKVKENFKANKQIKDNEPVSVPKDENGNPLKLDDMNDEDATLLKSKLNYDMREGTRIGKLYSEAEEHLKYEQINIKEQLDGAIELVLQDVGKVMEAVRNNESIGKIRPNSLYVALVKYAPLTNDLRLVSEIASLHATEAGQSLRILRELDRTNPINIIKEINDELAKRYKGKTNRITKKIDKEVREGMTVAERISMDMNEIDNIIDDLIC